MELGGSVGDGADRYHNQIWIDSDPMWRRDLRKCNKQYTQGELIC